MRSSTRRRPKSPLRRASGRGRVARDSSLILVVEDNDGARATAEMILLVEGYDVITARNGEEALRALARRRPAAILCDLNMPVVDGWTFRRLQLAMPEIAAIPFVVVSASLDLYEQAAALGADMALRKPIEADDLVRCARRFATLAGG